MSNDSDNYVKVSVNVLFGTPDAIKVEHNELSENIWIPRSVLFGPEESELSFGNIMEEKELRVRQWFAKKVGMI